MDGAREGGCSCGGVINLLIEAARVELTAGRLELVPVPRDDGSAQSIRRCPACRIAVFSDYGRPELLFVRAGSLDDPASVAPDVHIYTRSKLPWVVLPDGVPAFDAYYDSRSLWPQASLERRAALASLRERA